MWPNKGELDEEKSNMLIWFSKMPLAQHFPKDVEAGKGHSRA
jgi:hypothetical protein